MKIRLALLSICLFTSAVFAGKSASAQTNTSGTTSPQKPATPGDAEEVKRLNEQVIELFKQGKLNEAIEAGMRAVALAEKTFGMESRTTGSLVANLGLIHIENKQPDKAIPLFKRVLSIREQSTGPSLSNEKTALEAFICVMAVKWRGDTSKESRELVDRIDRVVREDSIIAQGISAPFADGEIITGKALHKPAPRYPEVRGLDGRRVSASVPMQVEIDEKGNVTEVKALACNIEAFAKASEQAMRGARFEPTVVRGKPVKVTSITVYNFQMR